MADDGKAEEAGFLSRWSRRKQQLRQGVAPPEPVRPGASPAVAKPISPATPLATDTLEVPKAPEAPQAVPPPGVPALTLADVAPLDYRSDFTRFVAPGVDSQVKNAALKKLFTDPHFNVMDRLDTYIDDYGLPDPLPPGMLRQMAQSQFLGLFDPAPEAPGLPPGEPVNPTAVQPATGSSTAATAAPTAALTAPSATAMPQAASGAVFADATDLPDTCPDENPALRLQSLDAAGPAGPDQGPGPDPGREH